MSDFEFNFFPLAIGSLPHTDPLAACESVLRHFGAFPFWPQLPNRSFNENMYVQYSEGFPGVVIENNERIYVDRSQDLDEALGDLYVNYLDNTLEKEAISTGYATGLHTLVAMKIEGLKGVKGHVTGPISWGLSVTDQDRRPVLYDEILADAIGKHLRLKAAWQESMLRTIAPETIVFVDEPYLSALGSAFVAIQKEQVINLLEEVFKGIQGLKGIHCCGNTDWSLLLSTSVDILNLDAYNFAETLSLYPEEVNAFLKRGGIIAWGIVPSEVVTLEKESVDSLVDRLENAFGLLIRKGIDRDLVTSRCLITPSCGLAGLSVELAERALSMTAGVSAEMKRRYVREVTGG